LIERIRHLLSRVLFDATRLLIIVGSPCLFDDLDLLEPLCKHLILYQIKFQQDCSQATKRQLFEALSLMVLDQVQVLRIDE
jgi:hypothetical protein